jgi:hypothetical protein
MSRLGAAGARTRIQHEHDRREARHDKQAAARFISQAAVELMRRTGMTKDEAIASVLNAVRQTRTDRTNQA